jgi:uncharacterized protein (DUF305 family)
MNTIQLVANGLMELGNVMNNRFLTYGLIGLLASGLMGPLNSAQAQPQRPGQSPERSANPSGRGMMGSTQMSQHFIEMMIPHHEGAIAMADLALSKAKRPEIKQLAEAIKKDQTREIQQMRTWYKQWYGKEVPALADMGMMGSGQGMMGSNRQPGQGPGPQGNGMMNAEMRRDMMGMDMDLEALKSAPDFDREFIRQMIPHHQMAVMMGRMVLNKDRPEIRNLAESIIKSQTAEIAQMRQWYQAWYQ